MEWSRLGSFQSALSGIAVLAAPESGEAELLSGLLGSSTVLDVPDRLSQVSSWHSHIPFAFWCVEALRPRVLVELGTHRGDSYCAFCQAVDRLAVPCACYAIDTWKGDPHAGFYDEDVLEELRTYHDARYARFSQLMRSTFDDALSRFADGSIDLLHIDGNHTYEEVRHDFESWLPKLSRRAVVLFHDTHVHERDFGVWRLWEEVAARHPHFAFLHGYGLGVLVVGEEAPEPARRLAATSPDEAAYVRQLFSRLGAACAQTAELRRLGAVLEARDAQLRSDAMELSKARDEAARQDRQLRAELDAHAAEIQRLRESVARLERSVCRRIARAFQSVRRLPVRDTTRRALRLLYWTATLRPRTVLRRAKYARLIRRSGLFDAEHYLAQLQDPAHAREDPIWHFLAEGAAAGLRPNRFFETAYYAERYPDAAAPGKNPLVHFIRVGARQGRNPGPLFDASFYLARYPDVAASEMNPLAFHLARGASEGRICHPSSAPELKPRALAEDLLRRAGELAPPRGKAPVLVVDHRILQPDLDSGSVRMFAIVKLLRELGHEVTFVSDAVERYPRYEEELRRLGLLVLHGFEKTVAHLAREGHRYGFALLSRPEVFHRYLLAVRAHALHATVVYDTVDLHWLRLMRGAEISGDPSLRDEAGRVKAIERLGAACADVVFAITQEEKEAVLALSPGARVEVVPNIHACRPSGRPWAERSGLMFIGGFEHVPNVDAVKWFVGEVLPLVRRRLPGAVLHVVGSKAPESILRLASASVTVHGYVPDPTPIFDGNRVFVSPLRFGAGMKGKIGHAMSHGLPVVTTSIGAEGMRLSDGENALVADGAEAFAAAVIRLHEDELLWSRITRGSLLHVQQNFSEEVVRTTLASIFSPAALADENALGEGLSDGGAAP